MSKFETDYLDLLNDARLNGVESEDRTGVGTYKLFGKQLSINLNEGFPMLTTKRMYKKSMIHELLWMINGDTNIQYLLKNGVTFWTEWPYKKYINTPIEKLSENERGGFPPHWEHKTQLEFEQQIINDDEFAKEWGSIGEYGYGRMWRDFPVRAHEDKNGVRTTITGTDQLYSVIHDLKNNPDSRRIIISAWHPYHSNRLEDALLPACHNYIQFTTEKIPGTQDRKLNCYFNMRSNDIFLGLPYNVTFYALFTHMIAQVVGMSVGKLVYSGVDVHLYKNHVQQAMTQLQRTPKALPTLRLNPKITDIDNFKYEDITIENYQSDDAIKADIAV